MKSKSNVQFCNSGTGVTLISFCNELAIGEDGWAMIAPFGDFPSEALLPQADGKLKRQPAIQRITKETGETMVAQFHNQRTGLKKFIRGCNIYLGHPDMPGMEKRYPDKTSKGVFADMEVRDKGIFGLPVFTNEGMDLVEGRKLVNGQKCRGFSGRLVDSMPDGESNGVPVYMPTKIVSAGLTPYPHLPVQFFNSDNTLASSGDEAATTTTTNKMKKKLLALIAALSLKPQFANAEAPTDGETEAALDLVSQKVTEFANEQTSIKSKLLALCKKVGIEFANEAAITNAAATLDQVADKVTALETGLKKAATDAQAEFANERTERINDELALALTTGKITEAEKPTWKGRLEVKAQFVNERTALRALTPKVKTTSVTLKRGDRETQIDVTDTTARRQFINEVSSEIATELELNPVKDARKIAAIVQQRHPALFKDVPHVAIKMPGSKK